MKLALGLKGLILAPLLSSQVCFAYYCSTSKGNGFINQGDSMEQVRQACGAPTSTLEKKVPAGAFQTTQFLMYSNIEMKQAQPFQPNRTYTDVQSKGPSIVVEITDGKVTRISQDGSMVQSTSACSKPLAVGATYDTVLSACGTPATTNMQNKPSDEEKTITIWQYDQGQFSNPLVLQFDQGKLVAISG